MSFLETPKYLAHSWLCTFALLITFACHVVTIQFHPSNPVYISRPKSNPTIFHEVIPELFSALGIYLHWTLRIITWCCYLLTNCTLVHAIFQLFVTIFQFKYHFLTMSPYFVPDGRLYVLITYTLPSMLYNDLEFYFEDKDLTQLSHYQIPHVPMFYLYSSNTKDQFWNIVRLFSKRYI